MGELYRLDFASGKSYVGITRRTAAERYADHAKAASRSGKGVVYAAWRKNGPPELVVLATGIAEPGLYGAERTAIALYGTRYPAGYNMTDGGDGAPSLSPEVAAKISQKLKGRKLSAEHCESIGRASRGRVASPESIQRMRQAQKGRTFTLEARIKMSEAKAGRKHSPETLAKMAAAQEQRRRDEGFQRQKPRKNYPRKPKQLLALRRAT